MPIEIFARGLIFFTSIGRCFSAPCLQKALLSDGWTSDANSCRHAEQRFLRLFSIKFGNILDFTDKL